ncbi:ENTH/VHS-like protein [Artemisia annua]|uniref:ENTH/VHS-like protein n=1 Tax=Artemisia annua TaxID=35608 RepID=A0A2U1NC24_ARTAN|nr:ENTH/VHS-like protein [Artemisia annua]
MNKLTWLIQLVYTINFIELIYCKVEPEPLKGDALNVCSKTAQETLYAIFAGEDNYKPPLKEGLTRQIEDFGNTDFSMPSDYKKSFLSEAKIATIKHVFNSITQAQS